MSHNERRHLRNGLLFTLPWIVGLGVFVLYPVAASAYFSFCDYSTLRPPVWVGLRNYRDLLADEAFYTALYNTLFFGALALPLGLVTSLSLALLLNTGVRGMPVFRTLFYLPTLVPIVASAMLWLWMFNGEYGILNYLLQPVLDTISRAANFLIAAAGGDRRIALLAPTWLSSPTWAKPALVIVSLWSAGGTMVIYLAGLQDVPTELYEAAEIDGAGFWKKLTRITLPLVRPSLTVSTVLNIIYVFNSFPIIWTLTEGGPANETHIIVTYLYKTALWNRDYGPGYAMATLTFAFLLAFSIVYTRVCAKTGLEAT